MIWIGVFLVSVVTDWIWAKYIAYAAQRDAWRASTAASSLVLCTAVATIAFVEDHMLVIPACLGAFAGTFLAVRKALN